VILVEELKGAAESTSEVPVIPNGLSAVALPKLVGRNHFGNPTPVNQEEALARLNQYLGELNEQGVDVISIFDVEVDAGKQSGVIGTSTEIRKFAVLRK